MKRKNARRVDINTFIATIMAHYRTGGNQTTAADAMGVTPAAVSLRLKFLRELGVKVPKSTRMTRKDIRKAAMAAIKNHR